MSSLGQFAYNRFERWRLAKALELYHPELAPTTEKKTKGEKSLQSSFVSHRYTKPTACTLYVHIYGILAGTVI